MPSRQLLEPGALDEPPAPPVVSAPLPLLAADDPALLAADVAATAVLPAEPLLAGLPPVLVELPGVPALPEVATPTGADEPALGLLTLPAVPVGATPVPALGLTVGGVSVVTGFAVEV
jgi:hypothetical protein